MHVPYLRSLCCISSVVPDKNACLHHQKKQPAYCYLSGLYGADILRLLFWLCVAYEQYIIRIMGGQEKWDVSLLKNDRENVSFRKHR